jgi:hypothetical protein
MKSLIANTFGAHAAEAWERFSGDHRHRSVLAAVGGEILQHFPPLPGTSIKLSALFAWRLEQVLPAPTYVIAGSLFIGGRQIFDAGDVDDVAKLAQADPTWNGHAWAVSGNHLVDLSVFHRAHWRFTPVLAAHVRRTFGDGKKVLIGHHEGPIGGLRYEPLHVLPQDHVETIVRDVFAGKY